MRKSSLEFVQQPKKTSTKHIPIPPEKDIILRYNDKDEVLKIIDNKGDIISYLTGENKICPLIGSKIIFEKELGQGQSGVVFQIKLEESESTKYVAKRSSSAVKYANITSKNQIDNVILKTLEQEQIPLEVFLQYNNIQHVDEAVGKIVMMPFYLAKCSPNYICAPQYSEYIISLLAGNLKRSGVSINFIDMFLFSTCKKGNNVLQYTFMEKIDTTLGDVVPDICRYSYEGINPVWDKNEVISIFIQTLHAVATYQRKLRIVHGDLHQDNIFLDEIEETSEWKGQKIAEADYFRYVIDGVEVLVPAGKYIVKIGDWGYGCKYAPDGKAEICNVKVNKNTLGGGDKVPTYYEPAYDLVFCTPLFYSCLKTEFLAAFLIKMFGGGPLNEKMDMYINSDDFRPKIELLPYLINARADELFKDKKLMGEYMKQPPKTAKIITLGEF
jgi:serine/threonine protein kinase